MNVDLTGMAPVSQMEKGIVAGIGLRHAATTLDILAALDAALAAIGASRAGLAFIATLDRKRDHPALQEAGRLLGVPIHGLAPGRLDAPSATPSARVAAYIGLPSVAEAAALACGPLLLEKQAGARVTCALSSLGPAYPAATPRAASAPATLSTSCAGP